jgi:hypothetical protein
MICGGCEQKNKEKLFLFFAETKYELKAGVIQCEGHRLKMFSMKLT